MRRLPHRDRRVLVAGRLAPLARLRRHHRLHHLLASDGCCGRARSSATAGCAGSSRPAQLRLATRWFSRFGERRRVHRPAHAGDPPAGVRHGRRAGHALLALRRDRRRRDAHLRPGPAVRRDEAGRADRQRRSRAAWVGDRASWVFLAVVAILALRCSGSAGPAASMASGPGPAVEPIRRYASGGAVSSNSLSRSATTAARARRSRSSAASAGCSSNPLCSTRRRQPRPRRRTGWSTPSGRSPRPPAAASSTRR